jgi:hypothetical protein
MVLRDSGLGQSGLVLNVLFGSLAAILAQFVGMAALGRLADIRLAEN